MNCVRSDLPWCGNYECFVTVAKNFWITNLHTVVLKLIVICIKSVIHVALTSAIRLSYRNKAQITDLEQCSKQERLSQSSESFFCVEKAPLHPISMTIKGFSKQTPHPYNDVNSNLMIPFQDVAWSNKRMRQTMPEKKKKSLSVHLTKKTIFFFRMQTSNNFTVLTC